MRWIGCLAFVSLIASCKSSLETCSNTEVCPGATFQLCSGNAQCRIVGSDGSSYICASCTDCTGAFAQAQLSCRAHLGGGGAATAVLAAAPTTWPSRPSET
jgi:hypothetical protein